MLNANNKIGPTVCSGDRYDSLLDIDQSIFLVVSMWASVRSKDPNTKVGAAVYDYSNGCLFLGYNGFPSGFPDLKSIWDNREPMDTHANKYAYVRHAEENAIFRAAGNFNPATSCLYVTHYPCNRCMVGPISNSGIKTIKYLDDTHYNEITERVAKELGISIHKYQAHFAKCVASHTAG